MDEELTGIDQICRVDAEHCAQIDMDYYANREVQAEIYALQSYDNFGCAGCAVSRGSADAPLAGALLVALLVSWGRAKR